MTSTVSDSMAARLESVFGASRTRLRKPPGSAGISTKAWMPKGCDLLWTDEAVNDVQMRRLWEAQKANGPRPVVSLARSEDRPGAVRVIGPERPQPLRELPVDRVLDLLRSAHDETPFRASSFLAREFERLDNSAVPGLRVKDLLTTHFARERLRTPTNESLLRDAIAGISFRRDMYWRDMFSKLGYQVDSLTERGYLLRYDGAPVAVIHLYSSAEHFGNLTDGVFPEGRALADCAEHGALWGILASGSRFRLLQHKPMVGAATGQHLEIDCVELDRKDRLYMGLLAPESLREGGWLTKWIVEAKDFGEKLRKGLEERLILDALPKIARGLGEHLESQGEDLNDRDRLRKIEEAALTLVFRFMFLLHTEARGYLPIESSAYRPHSARQLAADSLAAQSPRSRRSVVVQSSFSRRSTQRWDRLRTLVRMVRNGDPSAGVPAYNGSLFASDGFPGSALLEHAEISDSYLAPALAAIAYDTTKTDKPDAPGLDYAGLQIGHLGAIYEALLTLRLTRAPEDLAYDAKRDIFRPMRAGEKPAISKADLYYQAEKGGRKAGGVFYTRHEFVKHLLEHSLRPALDEHLEEVRKLAKREPDEAARQLFDFSIVDPAMGSAHFLTAALDMMADRIELFLAEIGGLPSIANQLNELSEGGDHAHTPQAWQQPEDGDLLRRLILKRCIYGVDLSPMAVEVANVTLWLASFVPGLALSYLGSNLKCGDALIGVADPKVVGSSYSPMLTGKAVDDAMNRAAELQRELAEIPDRTPDEVKRSERI